MMAARFAKPLAVAALIGAVAPAAATPIHTIQKIFDGGPTNQHSFRIPSLVKAKNGDLVAIAECRKNNPSDFGDINLVFRRSTNNGDSWGSLGEVVGVGPGTWGNPTAVVDMNSATGRIWLFMNWNSGDITNADQIDTWGERKVYSCYSDTNGASWSSPVDRTTALLPPSFTWDAIGPGVGIQLTQAQPGWLVIPARGRNIYSTNSGATWQLQTFGSGGLGESTVTELVDGRLLRNDRPTSSQAERRWLARGPINGTMGTFSPHDDLLDPRCEGSSLRYNMSAPNRIMFLNSASTVTRSKMRIRISYDGGLTWPISRRMYDTLTDAQAEAQGKGGYSSMAKWGNSTTGYGIGALIEINEGGTAEHRSIEYHKINLEWILDGAKEPKLAEPAEPAAETSPASSPSTATATPMTTPL